MPALKLYLCRHADAVDQPEGYDDEDRWLSEKGRKQARKVGKALRHEGEVPDVVFTSPLVRAVQTAEGLAHALEFDREILVERALAPGGRLGALLEAIAERVPDAKAVAVVGHEPMMSDWAGALLGSRFPRAFTKAAVLRVDFADAAEPGAGKAKFFLTAEKLEKEKL